MISKSIFLVAGLFFVFTCSIAQTQQQLDSLERLIPSRKGPEKVKLLNDLTYYHFQSNPQKAIKFGEQSLKLAKEINDKKLLANTYNDYSMPFLTIGNFEKVVWLNNKALEIRTQLKDTAGIISSHSKLGNAYFELGRYSDAQSSYNVVIKLAKLTNDEANLMSVYQNSANVLEVSGFVEEALQMQKDVQALARKRNDHNAIIVSLGNMGSCYRKLKNYKQSRACYLEAKELIEKTDDPELLSMVYHGLGATEHDSGNSALGLKYYKKAFVIYRKIDSVIGMGSVAGNIGSVYTALKEYDSASVYLGISLEMALEIKSYEKIASTYQELGEVEKGRNNYKKAMDYFQLESNYKDSVLLHGGSEALAEMFTKYEVEKKERELAENKVQIAEGKLQKLLLIFISVGLGCLILIVVLYFRRKRLQAKEELKNTRKEEKLLREQQLSEQKLEISRELHDNIGSQITYMISSMDNLAYRIAKEDQLNEAVQSLSEFGRSTMKDLRSTVWAMNTEDGSMELLQHKMEDLRLHIPLSLTIRNELTFNPELKAMEMLNLYRIAQESIQNSLKYAEATAFDIHIYQTEKGVTIDFTDNGKGFEWSKQLSGNGIQNMEHRCKQIGASFQINSEVGKGTRISCTLRHLSY